jgi:hypothetical protein
MLRARGSPSFHSHLPSRRGGWRADKAQCPDCSRRMSGSGRTMVHNGAPAPCGAPTGIFGLRLVNGRAGQELSVPGGLIRASPVGRFCVIADPQVPSRSVPYERLRKAPLELGSGWVTRRVKYEGCQEIFTEGEWAGRWKPASLRLSLRVRLSPPPAAAARYARPRDRSAPTCWPAYESYRRPL